jgi:large subunit ribosomal protein L25
MLTLEVTSRSAADRLESIRSEGRMPAVMYGKTTPSTPISVNEMAFSKVLREAGESTVVTLKVGGETIDTLIHDVAFDPVSGTPLHADFYVFDKTQKVEVSVPLEFVGVSAAVKERGGLIVKVIHELKVRALPKDLPHTIEVDLSALAQLGDSITAGDVSLPSGVELDLGAEEIIVSVSAPKEETDTPAAPIDFSAIEVEKKGKEKDGDAEPEA